MKRLIVLAVMLIGFLYFPVVTYAMGHTFTASNITYNSSTHVLTFTTSETDEDSAHEGGFTTCYLDNSCINSSTYNSSYEACTEISPHRYQCTVAGGGDYYPSDGNTNVHIIYNAYNGNSYIDTMYSQALTYPFNEEAPTVSPTITDSPTIAPTPPDAPDQIYVDSQSRNVYLNKPFSVSMEIRPGSEAFNAVQANVAVSSNLSVISMNGDADGDGCNLNYTKEPTLSDPSFVGSVLNTSSTGCDVYTMVLEPKALGTGTIHLTNGSIKAYADQSELFAGFQDASFTIAERPTPTPTSTTQKVAVTSPLQTYQTSYTLSGTKDASITHVFVNGSESGVTFPTDTTWQVVETLTLGNNNLPGDNNFTIDGTDNSGDHTGTLNIDVNLNAPGDINGDGVVDLTDASLFAEDFGRSSDLEYILCDMNNDGIVDLTDLSILAKDE